MVRLSHIEVNERYLQNNLLLLEYYINSDTWYKTMCMCGNIYLTKPKCIFNGSTIVCKVCSRKEKIKRQEKIKINDRFGSWVIIGRSGKSVGNIWTAKCDCGTIKNVKSTNILSGLSKSCGCSNLSRSHLIKVKQGDKYNRLTIVSFAYKRKNEHFWNCLCECGNMCVVSGHSLRRNHTKSCGCQKVESSHRAKANIVGYKQKTGKLTVIDPIYDECGILLWRCLCECGCYTNLISTVITREYTKSCGNCGKYINGHLVSYPQLELHKNLNKGIINYRIGNKSIDIAMVYRGCKIAIEYDCMYWHNKNGIHKDKKKDDILLKSNWTVLRIRAKTLVPEAKYVYNLLDSMIDNKNKYKVVNLE